MESEAAQGASLAREIRVTNHGKMNAWVDFALKFFEEHEEEPLVLHTLPHQGNHPPEKEGGAQLKQEGLHPSTNVIPRLISVVEIIKREYLKKLDPVLAEQGRLSGLYQYNELGTLEDREGEQEAERHDTEEERAQRISNALQGRNHLKIKKTAYMKVTLCRRQLADRLHATYQPPAIRKLSKSARVRAKRRLEKEKDTVAG